MLSRKDVENVFERFEDSENYSENWEFYRDSGNYNCWRTRDREWLLQVSHSDNVISIGDIGGGGFETVAARHANEQTAILFVTIAAKDAEKAYHHLREKTASSVMSGEISLGD